MNDPCDFGKNHHCPLWVDYNVTLNSLEETEEFCHGNWVEIERLDNLNTILFHKVLACDNISFGQEVSFGDLYKHSLRSLLKYPCVNRIKNLLNNYCINPVIIGQKTVYTFNACSFVVPQ